MQVQELMKQRDDAQKQVFEFRGKGDVTDRQVAALTKAHQDLQEQLVTTIEKEQIRQQHIERLHKKAIQSKDILVCAVAKTPRSFFTHTHAHLATEGF